MLTPKVSEMSMSEKDLSAYKDGLADAMLEGQRAEHHENMHFYKLGYDYGITLYSRLQESESSNEC